ncbi:BlyB family putative holin accessory protein (plasmid) [Borreliella valaisiana]|uniref:BlyB family putative holin accessory protein n=1 Tax=Borreliella valaisiana TaxID=62088 RepID=UPI001AEFCBAD|nr:BlyB family putative holin accessory protein [Borreliella valaisiana]WKC76619.1 BlyB family putative holin accessory protein [Borreliella valaisiana]WLN25669.1 BlyB family putative holin accessory protein [Borreliella valaisiana]WVN14633.1 BlyB family putative holin accessory protein [Borreliella valaisiana]
MKSKININSGVEALNNLYDFLKSGDSPTEVKVEKGIYLGLNLYNLIMSIYKDTISTLEKEESIKILNDIENVNNKITQLISSINDERDAGIIEHLREERNELMTIKTKTLQEQITKFSKDLPNSATKKDQVSKGDKIEN